MMPGLRAEGKIHDREGDGAPATIGQSLAVEEGQSSGRGTNGKGTNSLTDVLSAAGARGPGSP